MHLNAVSIIYLGGLRTLQVIFLYLRIRNRYTGGPGVRRSALSDWCREEEVVGWS